MKPKRTKLPLSYTAQIELCRGAKKRLLQEYKRNPNTILLGGLCYYFGSAIESWYPNIKVTLIRKFIPAFTRVNATKFASAFPTNPDPSVIYSKGGYWWNTYRNCGTDKTLYDLANRILFIDWLINDATEKRKQQQKIKNAPLNLLKP